MCDKAIRVRFKLIYTCDSIWLYHILSICKNAVCTLKYYGDLCSAIVHSSFSQSSHMTLFPNESTVISFLYVMYYDDIILRYCIG